MILNTTDNNSNTYSKIFETNPISFEETALEIFRYQYANNGLYRQFCQRLSLIPGNIKALFQIPFLPIGFFKTHKIATGDFEPEAVFESSGTTQTINSKHYVKDLALYNKSFTRTFSLFYGNPAEWCILALLPSYLERGHSSLVAMASELIKMSRHPESGFYLYDFDKLNSTLQELERKNTRTLLLGVTFALLDFAEKSHLNLRHTTIMETGGMKGRREELTREEVHAILCDRLGVTTVHSEYGMTELMSQAYSYKDGIFVSPPWMRVLIREEDDPLTVNTSFSDRAISGAVNIIDLANIHSCAFIATDDAGKLYPDGSFTISGRLDNSDIRGCSLLSL